jgi:membrane dipeptidase
MIYLLDPSIIPNKTMLKFQVIILLTSLFNLTAGADTMPTVDAGYPAADLHCDAPMKFVKGRTLADRNSHVTVDRLKKGRVALQVFACWVPPTYRRQKAIDYTLDMIQRTKSEISKYPDELMIVTDNASWQQCQKKKKIGVLLGIEGGHALGDQAENLRMFYKEGVRILTLTWNNSNKFATAGFSASKTKKDLGLTAEGLQLVKLADSLGVIIDLSHSSEKTFWDVLKAAKRPPIASHSCAKALNRKFQFRNLSDKQITALAQAGGIIGINFYPGFLGEKRKPADINSVADQFEYIKKLAGVECLALGSDFDGIEEVPKGLEGPDRIPDLMRLLEKRGFSSDEISKIALGNFIRYMGW